MFVSLYHWSLFAGGRGAGGCEGDPAGEAVSLEGLVHHQREGLSLHLVGCCCTRALQWLQWLVQVHPGREAGHHVLQRESRGRVGQLRYESYFFPIILIYLYFIVLLWLISSCLSLFLCPSPLSCRVSQWVLGEASACEESGETSNSQSAHPVQCGSH